jgi:hypothetical protein
MTQGDYREEPDPIQADLATIREPNIEFVIRNGYSDSGQLKETTKNVYAGSPRRFYFQADEKALRQLVDLACLLRTATL